MYLPHLHELNLYNDNKLLVFPIKDLTETNPVYILTNKDNAYVEGTDEFKHLLKNSVKDLEVLTCKEDFHEQYYCFVRQYA